MRALSTKVRANHLSLPHTTHNFLHVRAVYATLILLFFCAPFLYLMVCVAGAKRRVSGRLLGKYEAHNEAEEAGLADMNPAANPNAHLLWGYDSFALIK
jgi:hypothetical protein